MVFTEVRGSGNEWNIEIIMILISEGNQTFKAYALERSVFWQLTNCV